MSEPFFRRKDEKAFEELQSAVRDGNVIAFIGAGLSARVGYGDWTGFLDKLGSVLRTRTDEELGLPDWTGKLDDLPWLAEVYRRKLDDIDPALYEGVLRAHFAPNGRSDAAIDHISRAGFKHIVTTNYDESVDEALRKSGNEPITIRWWVEDEVKILMETLAEKPRQPHTIYLHGRHDEPGSIILSERDYVNQYVKSDLTFRKLFAIFSTRRVAFFGFSLSDPDITTIFRQVNSIHRTPRHFALLGLNEEDAGGRAEAQRDRLAEKYGIRAIFFATDSTEQDRYRRVVEILERLGRKSSPKGRTRIRSATPTRQKLSKWTSTPDFNRKRDPSDPQKGRFGGLSVRDGYALTAKVQETRKGSGWFRIRLEVAKEKGSMAGERVTFYVHDTFKKEQYEGTLEGSVSVLSLGAYGAFTVGVLVNDERTPLELDLAEQADAPKDFRER